MSLLATRIQNFRPDAPLDKDEIRPSRYGALDFALTDGDVSNPSSVITEDLRQQALRSMGTTVEVPVINYDGTISISNTRSVTIADSELTSALDTITFVTYSFGFTQATALFSNNEIAAQRDFDKKFEQYIYKLGATMDTAVISMFDTNKSQNFADLLGLYSVASNTVNASLAQKNEIIGDINALMEANDFFGGLNVIGNYGLQSVARKLSEDGLYNDKDRRYQWQDKNWYWSNRVSNAADKIATGYAVESGSCGLVYRLEREALLGTRSRTGHEWDVSRLPMLDIPVSTYYYESVGDYNAIAGAASADMTRAHKRHFGFSVDVAYVFRYHSDIANRATSCIKFDIANA